MKTPAIILTTALGTGVFMSAFFLLQNDGNGTETDSSLPACDETYAFLDGSLDCDAIDRQSGNMEDARYEVESFTEREREQGNLARVSVFFRDLGTRRWFGIDENVDFYPASLSKLPIAMMTYKIAEIDRHVLGTELPVSEEDVAKNESRHFREDSSLEAGRSYTSERLVHDMLTTSDNAPVGPLANASSIFQESIFSDLGIFTPSTPEQETGQWNVNARSYSNLFRILYNASYLRPEYSNTILRLLSESRFDKGLVAGVPEGTPVAHKYGEATVTDGMPDGANLILNDCGIVYPDDKEPYILCVMTRGKDFEELERIIRTISETVFRFL